jgi:2-hydroxycyclohexanecarboxyl-CoA dehydrogenase
MNGAGSELDRTIVITGAASPRGIGRATARRLLADGWHVGLLDRDANALLAFADMLARDHPARVAAAPADVVDPAAVSDAIDHFAATLPPVFGLVNLAGVSSATSYLEIDLAEWRRVVGINLDGVHIVTRAVLPLMLSSNAGGRIVSISSVSAQRGGGTFSRTAYSAAKAGIIGFSRSLAREVGAYGITVNAIAPGPIDTDIMGGKLTEERKAALIADQFLPRIGCVDDVAGAVSFLLGPDADFITGQTLNVNGGLYLG